jgi:hypothetical protein
MKPRIRARRIDRAVVSIGIAISTGIIITNALAQQADPAVERQAQDMLESAVKLMQAKQFPPACRTLELVLQKLPQATGARLELARCHRGEGRLASAWRQYVQVENLARIAGQKARAEEASKNATELARIVGKLQLDVPTDVTAIVGFSLTLDGQVQEQSSWGMPIPVDAMEHEIIATAPGHTPWTKRVFVHDNVKGDSNSPPVVVKIGNPTLPQTSLRIEVPLSITRLPNVTITLDGTHVDLSEWSDGSLIEAGSHEIAVSAPGYETWSTQIVVPNGEGAVIVVPTLVKRASTESSQQPRIPKEQPLRDSMRFDKRTPGLIGVVLGGMSIGVGAIFGGVAISRNRQSDQGHCDANDFCDDTGYALRSEALRFAHVSTSTIVVGSALVAVGATLIAIDMSEGKKKVMDTKDRKTTQVWLSPTSAGIRYAW